MLCYVGIYIRSDICFSMSDTKNALVLEGDAYNNFINGVRSKSSQKFYLIGLKKFMAYNNI